MQINKVMLVLCAAVLYLGPSPPAARAETETLSPREVKERALQVMQKLGAMETPYFITIDDDLIYKAYFPYGKDYPTVRLDSCMSTTWVGPGRFDLLLQAKVVTQGDPTFHEAQKDYESQCFVAREGAKHNTGVWSIGVGAATLFALILLL